MRKKMGRIDVVQILSFSVSFNSKTKLSYTKEEDGLFSI